MQHCLGYLYNIFTIYIPIYYYIYYYIYLVNISGDCNIKGLVLQYVTICATVSDALRNIYIHICTYICMYVIYECSSAGCYLRISWHPHVIRP